MPIDRMNAALAAQVAGFEKEGRAKGAETVVVGVVPARDGRGPRMILEGQGEREFIRMNSNSYLGMSLRERVMNEDEAATRDFGAGPGAVRFISGTYGPHVELERALARFHGRESAMLFSSAYATVMSTITSLTSDRTWLVSDELNHNCIINGMKLARPAGKGIYRHNDVDDCRAKLADAVGKADRVLLITDGIFSMRGDHAPLAELVAIAREFDGRFPENVVVLVDDSHGVGAFGATGRGTEEYTGARCDILIGTLGKAFGVNGGYVTADDVVIRYLRETAPMYIYSNPITVGETKAALAALALLDSAEGRKLVERLRTLTQRFEQGLARLGFETIPGEHPVTPLVVRDTQKTRNLVEHLFDHGVLATGLAYPVVPKGDEEIRFQVNADHTEADIDEVLRVLAAFPR